MSRFRSFSIVALTGCLFLNFTAELQAQSDAETSLKIAREAFAAEQYTQARDAAQQASQTDAGNPDIFLLLGKAHLQLGRNRTSDGRMANRAEAGAES
jgi:thioredoxin-like negative regulator of GroEL